MAVPDQSLAAARLVRLFTDLGALNRVLPHAIRLPLIFPNAAIRPNVVPFACTGDACRPTVAAPVAATRLA